MSSIKQIQKNIDKKANGMTNAGQRLDALGRITQLEEAFAKMAKGLGALNQRLVQLEGQQSAVTTTVSALIDIEGMEKVQQVVRDQRRAELEAQAVELATVVAKGVQDGELVPVDEIGEGCLVVIEDRDPEGKLRVPARIHSEFETFRPDLRDALRGKKVSDTVSVAEYNSTVLAIYKDAKKQIQPANKQLANDPANPAQAEVLNEGQE